MNKATNVGAKAVPDTKISPKALTLNVVKPIPPTSCFQLPSDVEDTGDVDEVIGTELLPLLHAQLELLCGVRRDRQRQQ